MADGAAICVVFGGEDPFAANGAAAGGEVGEDPGSHGFVGREFFEHCGFPGGGLWVAECLFICQRIGAAGFGSGGLEDVVVPRMAIHVERVGCTGGRRMGLLVDGGGGGQGRWVGP